MTAAPIIAGIDSAETSGIVVIAARRIIRRGLCVVRSWADVERAADVVAALGPSLVAVEDCYVRTNAATGLTLARLQGRWLQAFERRSIPTLTVLASTWQPSVLAGRMTSRTPGPERKLAAIAWAFETYGVALPPDQADAAAIAHWALEHVSGDASGVDVQHANGAGGGPPEPPAQGDQITVRGARRPSHVSGHMT